MVSNQQLKYDFQYHQMHLEVDCPIVALSHGKVLDMSEGGVLFAFLPQSLFEIGCKLVLQPATVDRSTKFPQVCINKDL